MDFTNATATDAQGVTGPIQDSQWVDSGIERIAGIDQALATVTPLKNSGWRLLLLRHLEASLTTVTGYRDAAAEPLP